MTTLLLQPSSTVHADSGTSAIGAPVARPNETECRDQVLRSAIESLLDLTQAERGAVYLLEEDGTTLRPAMACTRTGSDEIAGPVAVSSTVAHRILTERKGIITAEAGVVSREVRSIACVPLVGQAGALGILYLEKSRPAGVFAVEDLGLLSVVGSQVGLALENARSLDALRQAYEELERKMEHSAAELRNSELKRYQAERMASLSRLVAGVAHQINTPLGVLKCNMELATVIAGRLATSDSRQKNDGWLLQQLVRLGHESGSACGRIIDVVRALRSFARLDEAEFKLATVNEGLSAAVLLLDPAVQRRVEVVLNLGDVPAISCYPALLNEAFMNLLLNACQAIPEKGQIFVETWREGDEVVISIRDTGRGIPLEHRNQIFDPGFTTRGAGVGVGLGLAIAWRVVQEHQGSIQVVSEPGHGAAFIVRLPIFLKPVANPVADS
jgi:signal transduction histidine kinase